MKTLIVYSSKYGCTADCAEYLSTKLSGEVSVVDINKATHPIELGSFDTIIIGSSVYVGKITKKLRVFCEDNLDLLLSKKVGIFLCCAQPEQANEFLAANFPAALLDSAVTTKVFGSEIRLESIGFFDKMLLKAATTGDYSNLQISNERMDEFIQEMIS